jgi:hypothetical protein
MSESSEPSRVPREPAPARVPVRGVSGRLAILVVAGAAAVIVGVALLGRASEPPRASPAALEGSNATPTPGLDRATEQPPDATGPPPARTSRALPTGGTPLPDTAGALAGDDGSGPLPLGSITEAPNPDRLDFLFELCPAECFRDAHWLDPRDPDLGSGVWTAGRPFHVREGFVNDSDEPLGEGFDVVLYVTRLGGAPPAPTYRYTSDYVLRGTTDRCGPTYETQAAPQTCEWFVHDFAEGLPAGRHAIWAVWEAPCRAWIDLGFRDSCRDPDEVLALFSSGFDAPYERPGPDYSERRPPRLVATAIPTVAPWSLGR